MKWIWATRLFKKDAKDIKEMGEVLEKKCLHFELKLWYNKTRNVLFAWQNVRPVSLMWF